MGESLHISIEMNSFLNECSEGRYRFFTSIVGFLESLNPFQEFLLLSLSTLMVTQVPLSPCITKFRLNTSIKGNGNSE